ncbi:MAG: hypothetical protein WCO60_20285 [Verrucomicrobiota bacterium]
MSEHPYDPKFDRSLHVAVGIAIGIILPLMMCLSHSLGVSSGKEDVQLQAFYLKLATYEKGIFTWKVGEK